jgi:heme-degrading monooxygenase HmoA
MPSVSVTRLRLASRIHFPQFLFHSLRSIGQVRRSRGYLGGWTGRDAENGFWTATVWENADQMRAFRNSGAHLKAMPKLLHMCDQASYTHFEQPAADVPTAEAAFQALSRDGKMSKVNAPSPQHLAGQRVGSSLPRTQHWSPRPAV